MPDTDLRSRKIREAPLASIKVVFAGDIMGLRPLPSPPVAWELLKVVDSAAVGWYLEDLIGFLNITVLRISAFAQMNVIEKGQNRETEFWESLG
jgi:hypothetical protein